MTEQNQDNLSARQKFAQWYSQSNSNSVKGFKNHTIAVSATKVFTSLIAILLVGLLIAWPLVFTPEETLSLKFTEVSTDEDEIPVMMKPVFHGLDSKNQPFNVVADEAIQQAENEVYLKNISGDITLEGGKWMSLTSKEGKIFLNNNTADLMGDVNIISEDGFEFKTNSAHVDFSNNTANGNENVVGQGPIGVLNSVGFSMTDNGNEILFKGPVKLTIYPGSGAI